MTKFEEEVTRPDNGPITELNNSMHSVLSQYRKMREYADYLEYELKQKDEHILKLENENSFMRDECTTFDSNGMAVEPKLQQQALPVVPECVAGAIAWDEQMDNSIAEILKDIFTANDKDLKEAGLWVKNNPEKYIIARNIGYTVEKPQLFYIDLPKVFGLSDSTFVSKAESGIISEFTKGKDYALKLTEQEIKSIDERYWQFAVPVEVEK
ncbi:ORF19 [Lactococcus phage TP901-1]|uniref:ORF19 n=2 Tax=root TaxID=1 RepID=UPI000009B704|nr:ORF19 [Lactococcus phage TP901-1]AAK38036.1 ORF19 [Lactococcus phage TP901-1]